MMQKPSEGQQTERGEILRVPEVVLRPNTPDEEFQQIKRTIRRKDFYEQKGYTFVLPESAILREPIPPEQEDEAFEIFVQSEYDKGFYVPGMSAMESKRGVVASACRTFSEWHNEWGFFVPETYNIRLTRYGSGGSYNPNTGDIVMLTTRDGMFKRGANPAHTVIHEATHIGLEKDFVREWGLTHEQKERLVDLVVAQHFSNLIPEYKLQSLGDTSIDGFLTLEDMASLDKQLGAFANPKE